MQDRSHGHHGTTDTPRAFRAICISGIESRGGPGKVDGNNESMVGQGALATPGNQRSIEPPPGVGTAGYHRGTADVEPS